MAGGHRAGRVGEVLALAGDSQLHERRHERGDDRGDEPEHEHDGVAAASAVVVAVAAAEERHPQEQVRDEADTTVSPKTIIESQMS